MTFDGERWTQPDPDEIEREAGPHEVAFAIFWVGFACVAMIWLLAGSPTPWS